MGLEAEKGLGSRVVEGRRAAGGAGLFLLLVSLQDVREGRSLSDTGCQPVSRRPSLAEEQWGSLLSPLPRFVSLPVGKDKREGTWLSGR